MVVVEVVVVVSMVIGIAFGGPPVVLDDTSDVLEVDELGEIAFVRMLPEEGVSVFDPDVADSVKLLDTEIPTLDSGSEADSESLGRLLLAVVGLLPEIVSLAVDDGFGVTKKPLEPVLDPDADSSTLGVIAVELYP